MRQYLSSLKSASRKLFEGSLFGLPKRDLENGVLAQKPFVLEVDNGIVPLSFRRGTTDTLVVSFHGAVNKEKRTPPVFPAHSRFSSPKPHQLSISDPTILLPGDFGVSWYAGHEGFDTQAAILDIVREAARMLKARNLIFLGGSAGGFAALYNSWHFEDSYAVVAGPQTNLDRYSLSRKQAYRQAVWPSLAPKAPLAGVTCANLCKLYDKPMTNNVVMFYSAGDRYHFDTHMLPFTGVMAKHASDRFVLECGYWGIEGHSGAVPPMLLNDWLRVIVRNPGVTAANLIAAVHDIRSARGAAGPDTGDFTIDDEADENSAATDPRPAAPAPSPGSGFAQPDITTASRLSRLMMGRKDGV